MVAMPWSLAGLLTDVLTKWNHVASSTVQGLSACKTVCLTGAGRHGNQDPLVMECALSRPTGPEREEPGWVEGLRQLYKSVVDEPLPDSFNELLRKLDESGDE